MSSKPDCGPVAAEGHDRVGEVRGQVRRRQDVAGRTVGARIQDRPRELAGHGRQGQESIQEYDTEGTAPRDIASSWDSEDPSRFWDTIRGLKKDPGK